MITITIEETDKRGRVLVRHEASAPIERSDASGLADLIARGVGGMFYGDEGSAEMPLLIAAGRTYGACGSARAIAHAAGMARSPLNFSVAVKPVVDIDRLLGWQASRQEKKSAAWMLGMWGAKVRREGDDD